MGVAAPPPRRTENRACRPKGPNLPRPRRTERPCGATDGVSGKRQGAKRRAAVAVSGGAAERPMECGSHSGSLWVPVTSSPEATARAQTSGAPLSLQAPKPPSFQSRPAGGSRPLIGFNLWTTARSFERSEETSTVPILRFLPFWQSLCLVSFVFFSKPSTFSQRSLRRALVARSVLCSLFSGAAKAAPWSFVSAPQGKPSTLSQRPARRPAGASPIS